MRKRPPEDVGAGQQGAWHTLWVIVEEERGRRLVVETDRCSRGIQRMLSKWCSGLVSASPGEEGGEERVRRGGGFSLL